MLQALSIRQAQQAPMHLFHRPELARSVAKILMSEAGQRGMLLSGPRQTGKSTFVQWDLIPLLAESHGAHVVYIDLSADCDVDPAVSIVQALRDEVRSFDGLVMRVARGLGLTNIRLGGLEMDVAQAHATHSKRTFGLLRGLARAANRPVVIVLDEVQLCQQSQESRQLLIALTRSAARLSRERECRVRVLATGSHAHKLRAFVESKYDAFYGGRICALPLLGDGFVAWMRDRLREPVRPTAELMAQGFQKLLHRPQELIDVCDQLRDAGARSQLGADQTYQQLVDYRCAEGRDDLMRKLRSLGAVELALVRVMAETGPRFAPHQAWCKKRTAALIEVMQGAPHAVLLTMAEVDLALDRLASKAIIWRGVGCEFEEPRYASWILEMDPAADFCVETQELPELASGTHDLVYPVLLS